MSELIQMGGPIMGHDPLRFDVFFAATEQSGVMGTKEVGRGIEIIDGDCSARNTRRNRIERQKWLAFEDNYVQAIKKAIKQPDTY